MKAPPRASPNTSSFGELYLQYHDIIGVAMPIFLFFGLLIMSCFQKKSAKMPGPYRDRDFLHQQDLVDSEIRRHHLDFNEHLHSRFEGQRFLQVKGEYGCYIAFNYTTCKEVMNDHSSFSSNPFPDGRLVALNTMSKADHTRVLRYVHKHYTQDALEDLRGHIQEVIQQCTADLASGKVDGVQWAKRIHMSGTLARLGVKLGWEKIDEIVMLNDAMVALVAPLGGVGLPNETLPWTWLLQLALGLIASIPSMLQMVCKLGMRCSWQIIRPDVTILNPPRKPRMGLWWRPGLLPLVPRYFMLLHTLLEDSDKGLLLGLREGVSSGDLSLAESLTLMVQLMVNMTSANALSSLLFRLATETDSAQEVFANFPASGDAFIQEVLRLDAPLQRNPRRCVSIGKKWQDAGLKEGNQVLLFLGAANMDPAVFRSPADFRIDRADESPALTFGSGMHYCLGSNLVKLEMRLALEHLTSSYKSIALDGHYQRIADVDVGNWGFCHLPIRLK
ncbi:unnamed protein product [Durusdinium trenchii]|uniref:Cytochrome P450 144 n=2 Tax=Durusdinium trenchii TaxID=1381693 RepID=A0ABP0KK58_9DINO